LLDVVNSDGHIVAQKQNPAVTKELLQKFGVGKWKVLLIQKLYVSPTANGTNRIFVLPVVPR